MAGPNKLRMLLEENDEVFKAGRRSPEQGWRYFEIFGADDAQDQPQFIAMLVQHVIGRVYSCSQSVR